MEPQPKQDRQFHSELVLVIMYAYLKFKVYVLFFSGILPLDSEESGLCEVILVHEHYLGK